MEDFGLSCVFVLLSDVKWLATLCIVNISLYHLALHFLLLQIKQTALHLASISENDKVCQVLLEAGADVHATDMVSRPTIISILSTLVTVPKLKILYIFFDF